MISRAIFGCLLACVGCAPRARVDFTPDPSERLVATPSALVVLSQAHAGSGVPGAVTFGDPNGRSALYLQFLPDWRAHGAPLKGFLALEPRAGQTPDSEPVQVQVWRVRSPWQPSDLHAWSDKPELAPPFASSVTSTSPARTLRIDITELLTFAAHHPELDQGIAIISGPGDGHGATFATGISGGAAPRLEVYTR